MPSPYTTPSNEARDRRQSSPKLHPPSSSYVRCYGMSVRIGDAEKLARKTIAVLAFIAMLLIAFPSALSAQQQPEPKPLRFDFTPFIGYRTSMSFPVEPHVTRMNPRVVLAASPGYGVSFGMRLKNENDLIELRWARQDSYVHAEDITPPPPVNARFLISFMET